MGNRIVTARGDQTHSSDDSSALGSNDIPSGDARSTQADDSNINRPESILESVAMSHTTAVSTGGGASNQRLRFHQVHGINVRLTKDRRVATRTESFCKALAFSDRPVAVDETVCLRFTEVNSFWNGLLRLGITNSNPDSFGDDVPKYACPDMTNKEGTWAKAINERYCQQGNVLYFFIRESGEMYYGINGTLKGLFLTGINTRLPMFVVVDIYGNTTAVEFVVPDESETSLMKRLREPKIRSHSSLPQSAGSATSAQQLATILTTPEPASAQTPQSAPPVAVPQRPPIAVPATATAQQLARDLEQRLSFSRQQHQLLVGGQPAPVAQAQAITPRRASPTPDTPITALRYSINVPVIPLSFHVIHGPNVRLNFDRSIATRNQAEYCRCYVFTSRAVHFYEKLIVQILSEETQFEGGIAFGVTNCDPLKLSNFAFPDDSDDLSNRPEFWAVHKDVATCPVPYDELTFYINSSGEVHFQKNNSPPRILMYLDVSLSYYMFFDVYGRTQSIRLVGYTDARATPQLTTVTSTSAATATATATAAVAVPPPLLNRQETQPRQPAQIGERRLSAPATAAAQQAPEMLTRPVLQSHQQWGPSPPVSSSQNQQPQRRLTVHLPPPLNASQADRVVSNVNTVMPSIPMRSPSNHQSADGALPMSARPNRPPPPVPPPKRTHSVPTTANVAYTQMTARPSSASLSKVGDKESDEAGTSADQSLNLECSICMNQPANSLVYPCGHVCMCYECGRTTWSRQGHCPICRRAIKDIVRMYVTG